MNCENCKWNKSEKSGIVDCKATGKVKGDIKPCVNWKEKNKRGE